MSLIEVCHKVAFLIFRNKFETLSPEEEKEFSIWLEKEENKNLLERFEREKIFHFFLYKRLSSKSAWNKFNKKYPIQNQYWKTKIAIAASFMILGSSLAYFYFTNQALSKKEVRVVASGKAILSLNDGTEVAFGNHIDTLISDLNVKAKVSNNFIAYDKVKKKSADDKLSYNTLQSLAGGGFGLQLIDGSQIILNTKSKLKYPVRFSSKTREIWLEEGEIFCDVAKDRKRPFMVHLSDGVTVKVLGTSFNIKSYKEEDTIETFLVEGEVELVERNGEESRVVLKPMDVGRFVKGDNNLYVDRLNNHNDIAWMDNKFVYDNERLEEVLNGIARWYDVSFEYKNKRIKNMLFTLDISRAYDLEIMLESIEEVGGVKFSKNGAVISVSNK
ncbi:FecR domain-containing protein [Tamlana sp. 2201CG12-4]|uniref:FecR family protein n=1 Tax=Tamlana sp. 2201CG12-4 TaxID=3112582 RepID=UPI002DB68A61|nr:FecR domain-containing protein [Tamlana sp. 2201CG12-4]MEC3908828.1 FecR domain-containing protein [Tamlana sp. 2201CG12-4]